MIKDGGRNGAVILWYSAKVFIYPGMICVLEAAHILCSLCMCSNVRPFIVVEGTVNNYSSLGFSIPLTSL